MSNHTAPSGFTFNLRLPEAVPERLRRPVAAKLVELAKAFEPVSDGTSDQADAPPSDWSLSPEDLQRADDLNDLLAVALLLTWSSDAPISVESMLDLSAGDYAAIRAAVAPQVIRLMPDFSPTPEAGTPTTP